MGARVHEQVPVVAKMALKMCKQGEGAHLQSVSDAAPIQPRLQQHSALRHQLTLQRTERARGALSHRWSRVAGPWRIFLNSSQGAWLLHSCPMCTQCIHKRKMQSHLQQRPRPPGWAPQSQSPVLQPAAAPLGASTAAICTGEQVEMGGGFLAKSNADVEKLGDSCGVGHPH